MAVEDINPVVRAYLSGVQQRQSAEKQQQDQENALVAQKQAQQQIDQRHTEFEAAAANEQKRIKMESDAAALNKQLQIHNLVSSVLKSKSLGEPTPDLQEHLSDPGAAETYSGMQQPPVTGSIPGLVDNIDLTGTDPTEYAKKQADLERIKQAPSIEKADALEQGKSDAALKLQDLKSQGNQIVTHMKAESDLNKEQEKSKAAYDREVLKNAGAMNVEGVRSGTAIQVANINAQAGLDRIAQKAVTLSSADSDKLANLDDIKKNLLNAKAVLDANNYDFFKGPVGGLATVYGPGGTAYNGESAADVKVKDALGSARQAFVTGQTKKVFSKSEEDLLSSFLPDPNHMKNPGDIKGQLEDLLSRLDSMKASVGIKYAPKTTTSTTISQPTNSETHIFFDASGKMIGASNTKGK